MFVGFYLGFYLWLKIQILGILWLLMLGDHSLVAYVSIEASSSDIVRNSEANDNWQCLSSSSSSSNDDIIQDYDFNGDLKENDVFVSKEILSKCFYLLTVIKNVQIRTTRSNSNSLELKCLQDCCQWYVCASRYKKSDRRLSLTIDSISINMQNLKHAAKTKL